MPKFNLYQSLHTTVVGPQGKPLEVQIRTREMHQPGRVRRRRPLGLQGRRHARRTCPWLSRIIDWQKDTNDPEAFMETLKVDLEQDEVYVFTPKGKVAHARRRRHADRLRLRDPHRGRPRLHRRPGQRPAGAARLEAGVGRHRRDLHVEGRGRRGRPATGCRSSPRPGRPTRSASGSPASGARTPSRTAATTSSRPCGARVCRCRRSPAGTLLADTAHELNYADLDALHAAIGENHVSAKSVAARIARAAPRRRSGGRGAAAHHGPPAPAAQPLRIRPRADRRARRGPRRRDGAAVEVLHAGAGRRAAGLHHQGPRRVGAPGRLRQRRVAVARRAGSG